VEEQTRLIELLKEKRQAVISHAVTKGLDPNAPMKDSGVEWLGEVPAHWVLAPLKRHWSVTDCKHVTAEFVADGIPLASIREAQSQYVDLTDAKQTTEEFYEQLIDGGRKPQSGDLIFTRNATVGEVAQVAEWHPPFAMGQDVCLLRKNDSSFSTDYLWHVLRSAPVGHQLANLMIGSTFKRVNVEEIRDLLVPMPPTGEQCDIARVLDQQTKSASELIFAAEEGVSLLKERRSALISAAVTGKIDVRGLVSAKEAEAA
jgi:type I restriction enzyme S subunit